MMKMAEVIKSKVDAHKLPHSLLNQTKFAEISLMVIKKFS